MIFFTIFAIISLWTRSACPLIHLDNLESPQKIETLCETAIHLLKIDSHFSEQTHFKLSIAITQGKIKALIFSVSIQVQRIQELLKN